MTSKQHSGGPTRQISSDRSVTGPSCRALRTAVSELYSVDDFTKEKIAYGFFSEVYKVTHRTTGQVMVLKMNQLETNRPNTLREVQLLNKLSHPNVLKFMGVCVKEGQLHALTEYIEGGSLEQVLNNKSDLLLPALKIRLALGIARGMAYVHDAGVFHRDLTSKNILVRKISDGLMDAIIGDFGLATKIPKKGRQRLETVGSPYWMSPECIKRQWYDDRSDVFSYGIVLCEIIARIEADPDILPRTDTFGLDYLEFIKLCPLDTPPNFLRLAYYCCIYDPKSRPTFHELVQKLTNLSEKITQTDEIKRTGGINNSIEIDDKLKQTKSVYTNNLINTNRNGVALKVTKVNNILNRTISNNETNKRNSIDVNITKPNDKIDNGYVNNVIPEHLDSDKVFRISLNRRKTSDDSLHRRSLSEHVIKFSENTAPSDKARQHLMRLSSRVNESICPESPIIDPFNPYEALRKVAETMMLKDPEYKPRKGEVAKSNPFEALAQLKGLKNFKKILRANPTTYIAGDLFSSCFEITAPLLKDTVTNNHKTKLVSKSNGDVPQPQSLPSSPTSSRKLTNLSKPHDVPSDYGSSDEQRLEIDLQRSTGTIKKYKVNSLFSHPLFNGNNKNDVKGSDSLDGDVTLAAKQTPNDSLHDDDFKSTNDTDPASEDPKIYTRRGSSESGFFSCFNEDFSSTYKLGCCSCFEKYRGNSGGIETASNEKMNIACRCCLYSNTTGCLSDTPNILVLDDSAGGKNASLHTCLNTIRSADDLDLSETLGKRRYLCQHHSLNNVDFDTSSIDMDLINRLTLDSKIRSLMQKYPPYTNQLIYCKNRTSSIYTDSSDDISSIAGSDSLLWDERSFATIPNTRSAQIAKIVEYFERKGQTFKPFNVPDSLRSTPSHRYNVSHFPECLNDVRRDYGFTEAAGGQRFDEYPRRFKTTSNDYETFCLELDKRPLQQRILVCEGAVKSKLPLFDKPNQKQPSTQKD